MSSIAASSGLLLELDEDRGPLVDVKAPRAIRLVTTGTPVASTWARSSVAARARITPPPTYRAGRFAARIIVTAAQISSARGTGGPPWRSAPQENRGPGPLMPLMTTELQPQVTDLQEGVRGSLRRVGRGHVLCAHESPSSWWVTTGDGHRP